MANYANTFYGFVYATVFLIVFVTAWTSLKPFKLHKKRKLSTLALKISYLGYLAVYMIFIFILIFNPENKINNQEITEKWLKFYLIVFLTITLIPNIGILVRKKIKKAREKFNITFSVLNAFSLLVILLLLSSNFFGIM